MIHDGQFVHHGRAELVPLERRESPLCSRLGEDVLELLGRVGFGQDLLEAVVADAATNLMEEGMALLDRGQEVIE